VSAPPDFTVRTPDGNVIPLTRPSDTGLAPAITSENAVEMAHRSAVKRKANKEEAEKITRALVASTQQIRAALPSRAELGGLAEAIVMKMAVMVLSGELAPRSAAEATNIAKAWSEIFRLEQGTATEIHEIRDQAKLIDRLAEIRDRVEASKGKVVPATAKDAP
jgi:hypothetical protein